MTRITAKDWAAIQKRAPWLKEVSPAPKKRPRQKRAKPVVRDQFPRREVDFVTVELPTPPGVNSLNANVPGVGRVKTKAYRLWRKEASAELLKAKPGHVSGPYSAVIRVAVGTRSSDIDGRTKAALDVLVGVVTDDDHLCQSVLTQWSAALPAKRTVIEIRKATEERAAA